MKKLFLLISFCLSLSLPSFSQIDSNGVAHDPADDEKTDKPTFKEKMNDVFTGARDGIATAAEKVGDAADKMKSKLGYDTREQAHTRKQYMPIYRKNKYKGSDGADMISLSRSKFYERYPEADIISSVIPGKDWQSEPVYKNGDIVGYLNTIYCYILARDGRGGYLNAEYTFQKYKHVGEPFEHVTAKWPEFSRVDDFSSEVYEQIK